MTVLVEGGGWSAARPGRTLPPGKTRYPFYRRLGGPHGRSGRAEKLVPTGIRSRTALYPQERPDTHFTGGWLSPQGRSGRGTKNFVPTGIRSWTVQPVAQSLYRPSYSVHRFVYVCTLQNLETVRDILRNEFRSV